MIRSNSATSSLSESQQSQEGTRSLYSNYSHNTNNQRNSNIIDDNKEEESEFDSNYFGSERAGSINSSQKYHQKSEPSTIQYDASVIPSQQYNKNQTEVQQQQPQQLILNPLDPSSPHKKSNQRNNNNNSSFASSQGHSDLNSRSNFSTDSYYDLSNLLPQQIANNNITMRSNPLSNTTPASQVVRKLFQQTQAAVVRSTSQRRDTTQRSSETAAEFARRSPKAGYLQKIVSKDHQYKRRFFVLKPSTHLYYFLTPNDTEPRGCIDLDHTSIRELDVLADGRFRFQLNIHSSADDQSFYSTILEARNEEVGQDWIRSIKELNLTYSNGVVQSLRREILQLHEKIKRLNNQVDCLRLVEKDRDDAIEDASHWKERFTDLNNALFILNRQMKFKMKETAGVQEENSSPDKSFMSMTKEQEQLEDIINDLHESNFSSLYNTSEMALENIRQTTIEADTALEESKTLRQEVSDRDNKLAKSEKMICKLWEENCSLRESVKQIKRDKKILVTEVKSLMKKKKKKQPPQESSETRSNSSIIRSKETNKLISELEQELTSGLRLHEEFLAANGLPSVNPIIQNEDKTIDSHIEKQAQKEIKQEFGDKNDESEEEEVNDETESMTSNDDDGDSLVNDMNDVVDKKDQSDLSPLRPIKLMLDDFHKKEEGKNNKANGLVKNLKKSSSHAENVSLEEDNNRIKDSDSHTYISEKSVETLRPPYEAPNDVKHHPVKEVNNDNEVTSSANEYASSSISSSSITENGQATTVLACPLADVVGSSVSNSGNHLNGNTHKQDGEIYHLTFYNQKIGLQFQKVPIESPRQGSVNSILTEAMSVDIPFSQSVKSNSTMAAAELRRVGSFSSHASYKSQKDEVLPVAKPLDAVLVCGFNGFDDSHNHRPKLGAKLVAFDGVSVEIGQWTFESIRRAIQARSRPITLSFRDDFLTMKQRELLTKATSVSDTSDINNLRLPPPPSKIDSYYNNNMQAPPPHHHNHRPASPAVSSLRGYHRNTVDQRVSSSYSSPLIETATHLSSSSSSTGRMLSSAIAPILTGFMSSLSQPQSSDSQYHHRNHNHHHSNRSSNTPRYLQGDASISSDSLQNHHDFKAGLL